MFRVSCKYLCYVLSGILVFVMACSVILHPSVLAEKDASASFPIIMYHHLTADAKNVGPYVIPVKQFESDLRYLSEHGYKTLSCTDLYAINRGEYTLPEKSVMLTFDDGQESFYSYAFPLLKKYNMCAVFSVIGRYSEQYSTVNNHDVLYAHVNWKEIKEIAESGFVEIANHSYNMHNNNGTGRSGVTRRNGESLEQYQQAVRADIFEFNKLFEQHVGFTPSIYTYPFGRFSADTEAVMQELNYSAVFTCYEKRIVPHSEKNWLLHLGRFNRPYGKSSSDYFKKLLVT